MLTIRRAEDSDIPRIGVLLTQVAKVHELGRPDIFEADTRKYTDEELEMLLKEADRPIFVAADDSGPVVGYAFCVILEKGGHALKPMRTLYIDDLCVDQEARRQRVGQSLFDYVKAYAADIGCYNLTLNVWACNPGAMAFYERQGMQMLKKEMETIL